jgi:hypothetical protein
MLFHHRGTTYQFVSSHRHQYQYHSIHLVNNRVLIQVVCGGYSWTAFLPVIDWPKPVLLAVTKGHWIVLEGVIFVGLVAFSTTNLTVEVVVFD